MKEIAVSGGTFLESDGKGLALVLPGRDYTVLGPMLYYIIELLLQKGFDVGLFEKRYERQAPPDWNEVYARDIAIWADECLSRQRGQRKVLVGKSLGTIGLSLLNRAKFPKDAKWIWLTPLLSRDEVRDGIVHGDSFVAVGTEDQSCYLPDRLPASCVKLIVEGADHSLDHPDGPMESIRILQRLIAAIDQFVTFET